MRILFDTNVILDVLLDREPTSRFSTRLMARVELGELEGMLAGTTVTTIFYLARKALGLEKARHCITSLLSIFSTAPITHDVLTNACRLKITDFEDAVLHEAGRLARVDGIVTRNTRDFSKASLRIYTPAELEALLSVV